MKSQGRNEERHVALLPLVEFAGEGGEGRGGRGPGGSEGLSVVRCVSGRRGGGFLESGGCHFLEVLLGMKRGCLGHIR